MGANSVTLYLEGDKNEFDNYMIDVCIKNKNVEETKILRKRLKFRRHKKACRFLKGDTDFDILCFNETFKHRFWTISWPFEERYLLQICQVVYDLLSFISFSVCV